MKLAITLGAAMLAFASHAQVVQTGNTNVNNVSGSVVVNGARPSPAVKPVHLGSARPTATATAPEAGFNKNEAEHREYELLKVKYAISQAQLAHAATVQTQAGVTSAQTTEQTYIDTANKAVDDGKKALKLPADYQWDMQRQNYVPPPPKAPAPEPATKK